MRSRAFLDQMGVEEALKLNGITDAQRNSVRELIGKIAGLKKDFDAQNSLPIADRDTQEMTRIAKELADAEKKLALLDAEITKKVPRYAQLRNPQTVTAAQAQAWCPQNRAVVEYVLWSDDYIGAGNENNSKDSYCIILAKNGAQIIKLDNDFDYSSCVNALRTKIIDGKAEQDFEKERNDLYARLCEPLVAKLGKDVNELVIVPDGNLSFLPFDILRKNSFDKDFGESYSIELSPSISISYLLGKNSSSMGHALAFGGAWYDDSLSEAQHRQMFDNASASVKKNSRKIQATKISPDKMSANQREAIEEIIAQKGIGGYLASKNGHWGNLPGTLTEVNRLQANVFSVGAMTLKTQDQVTESSVKKLSSDGQLLRYPILHFACHGYFDKYVPEICSLVFSEVSGKFSKVSNDDGYLTVPEVSVLDLNADMVCLSACETGMGEIRSGDGLVGLSRGFMVAGAKNVGVSLWSVDDEATSEFMVRMYKKRKEGMNYVDAYRAVKNEFRKDSQWSHPFYWAAFTLYGGAANAGTAFAAQNLKNDKSAAEDTYQRALSAKDNGEYSSALALSLEAANAGHVGAQGLLSQLYYEGKGINRDYAKALEWANKAAKKNDPRGLNTLGLANYYGNGAKLDGKKGETYLIKAAAGGLADAQVNLGNIYSSGRSARMSKAVEYYSMAAEQGDVRAEYALGVMYFNGNGVPKNYYTALDFFKRAANQNNGRACNDIGLMYQYEYGVQKDESLALEYFLKGAELGDAMAQSNAGLMYETRGEIFKAVYWYEKSAEQNNAASQRRLGNIFQSGYQTGVKGTPDYARAKSLFEKAAAQNDALAQHYLARIYYEGKGIPYNYFKAFEFEKKAAENGLPEAQFWTGYMYEFGQGVNASISAANDWYKKASAGGNLRATYNLGINYWNANGVSRDYVTALDLFNRVVEKGQTSTNEYLNCLFFLGYACEFGQGTKQDYPKALEWYQKAAALGQSGAQNNLGVMYEAGWGV
ncbi:MAG: CHAT domain-containing protein, partial [Treponema sp.]|nr:CHAT domain-containing protein [Treponema sp.]